MGFDRRQSRKGALVKRSPRFVGVCITEASLSAQLRVEGVSRMVIGTLDRRGSVQVGRLGRVGIVRRLLQSGCKGYEKGRVEEDVSQSSYAH